MGLIKQGILGGFSKKTGTVVGAYWRRLDVIRALPRKSGKAPTQSQLEQQQKFGLVTAFLGDFSELIDVGFKSTGSATPMNLAVAHHLQAAIIGASPNFAIDLENFRFSEGKVVLPDMVTANAISGGGIHYVWDGLTDEGKFIQPTDKVTVLAYNADKQRFVKVIAATTRAIGEFVMQMPQAYNGDTVHLYISFTSAVKKLNSNSLYLGTDVVSF